MPLHFIFFLWTVPKKSWWVSSCLLLFILGVYFYFYYNDYPQSTHLFFPEGYDLLFTACLDLNSDTTSFTPKAIKFKNSSKTNKAHADFGFYRLDL